ncbi:hypothetical protein KJ810_03840, partial [Patescibacteria group bacterium]|nr:hypothetical protein [Patescibacteria group bacterium]
DFKESVRDAGDAAIGDYLDTLTTDGWGWSLCYIDPTLKANIQVGIGLDLGLEDPRQAKCTATSIYKKFTDGSLFQTNIDIGFSIKGVDPAQLSRTLLQQWPDLWGNEQTNVGQYLTVYKEAAETKLKAETAEAASQEKGFKDLVSAITGRTKTPAATIEATQNFALSETTTAEETNTGSIIADMVGVFTNTLVKKYMEFILVKGLNPAADSTSSQYGGQFGRTSSIAAAEAKFASFNQPNLSAGGSVDILNTLSSCPTSFAEPENCVIDSSFRTAVEQQLRLEEAIDRGYINGNKPFGYGDGGSQLNYTEGYPYRSLVLLRRHRVVPVSWELAASYIREYGGGARSLNDLIREFDDESSQYYQLIDPDWVLKAPASQCVNSGYGETFLFDEYLDADGKSETPKVRQIQRNTSCVDDQSCLSEDEAGNCQQYGYCTKEDPIWRFGGDSCPDYYNTCTTYIDSQGQPDSYLRDTLDFNGCSADNVGCQWYCKEYNEVDDRWECYWDDVNNDDYSMWSDGLFDPWGLVYTPGPDYRDWMSHLTAGAETCTADVAGCNEYIRTTHGTNLINNASFEYYTGDPDDLVSDTFDAWVPIGSASIEAVTPDTPGVIPFSGITALSMLPGAPPLSEGIMSSFNTGSPIRARSFTFSVYAMSANPTACNNNGQVDVGNAGFIESSSTAIDNISDQWQRYEVTVNLPDTIVASEQTLDVRFYADSNCDMLYDAAMLEESSSASQYADYGTVNRIYLTGERDTCDPDDVGCQWYDPLAGGDQIPAKITSSDQCSSQDVGCKAFEEVPLTTIVPDPNHIERFGNYCHGGGNEGEACLTSLDCGTGYCFPSISFIPDTGLQCSATYVGCEEYTNLDEVADGGEGKEYYSYLKQCVLPGEINTAPYYAWEGDAVAGYQLRAFRLKQSDIGLPYAPCTHLEVGPTLPLDCEDGSNTVIDCGPAGTNEYGTNPDCTQFFDASLNVFYRYKSQTITVSDDCHPERNSIDEDIYYGIPSESRACPQEFRGCREYLGNSGYNYRQISFDDFEDGTRQGWGTGSISTESVLVNGHSLDITTINATRDLTGQLADKKTYMLNFWARGSSSLEIRFTHAMGTAPRFADNNLDTIAPEITLTDDWREYKLGPVYIDLSSGDWTGLGLPDGLVISGLTPTAHDYFDNIELVETTSS